MTDRRAHFMLSSDEDHAIATISVDGLRAASVSRSGRSEGDAIPATLRALADHIDGESRARRRLEPSTWIRLSADVDVKVPTAELNRARMLEASAQEGNRQALIEASRITVGWMYTALDDPDARNWQSFDWALVDECDPTDFPSA